MRALLMIAEVYCYRLLGAIRLTNMLNKLYDEDKVKISFSTSIIIQCSHAKVKQSLGGCCVTYPVAATAGKKPPRGTRGTGVSGRGEDRSRGGRGVILSMCVFTCTKHQTPNLLHDTLLIHLFY